MSDDLDALLARADQHVEVGCTPPCLIADLAAAVRTLQADYDTALDVIIAGQDAKRGGALWPSDVLTEAERRVWQDTGARRRAVLAAAETHRERTQ